MALAHFQKALEITEPEDFEYKYDLQSAFFHLKIFPGHQKFLGAKFCNKNGKEEYFVFKHLPFGLASAVHAITKIFKPINAYLSRNGVRHTIFIDDGRVLSKSKAEADKAFSFTMAVLQKAGWQIEQSKTDQIGASSTLQEYLGFQINTQT